MKKHTAPGAGKFRTTLKKIRRPSRFFFFLQAEDGIRVLDVTGVQTCALPISSALQKGIEYFEQAIALDPCYSLAYAGLADSYVTLGYWNYLPPTHVFPRAR